MYPGFQDNEFGISEELRPSDKKLIREMYDCKCGTEGKEKCPDHSSKNFQCDLEKKGDGKCDKYNNNCSCDWDGGDCCLDDLQCSGNSIFDCQCLDPSKGILFEFLGMFLVPLPLIYFYILFNSRQGEVRSGSMD